MRDLSLEKLTSSVTLRALTGRGLPVSEAEIARAMETFWWSEPTSPTTITAAGTEALASLLRTGAIFVFDAEDVAGADEDASWDVLPKLPFPRVFFEFVDGDGDPNFVSVVLPAGDLSPQESINGGQEVMGFAVAEIEEGQEWLVVEHRVSKDGIFGLPYRYKAGGVIETPVGQPELDFNDDSVATIPLTCAHLVSARGVRVPEAVFPRAERRRYERKMHVSPPRVYRVEIGGDPDAERVGVSERTYRCRWLVRGHWRHHQGGGRSWVRPYVKGPVGAPWRGRPIYTSLAA